MITNEKMPVNDGGGLFDNKGLCDTLINDLNNLVKFMANGQYIQFCATITVMGQKLVNLKKGIQTDIDSMTENIEELKRMNDSLMEQVTGLPVEKDGVNSGEN